MTSVSLILPVYNAGEVLDHVLTRLAENTTYEDVELVAVDDGSTDASLEILRSWEPRFPRMTVHTKENGGAIDTLNYALERASGDVVVQLDADASIETHGWLEKMLGLLESDDRVGVVTAKIVMDDGFVHACGVDLVAASGMQDRPTTLTEPVGERTWHFRAERMREGVWADEDVACEVDAGLGCCLMYRRADALEAGGYDRGYSPVWFDDIDLCLGIRKLGRKVFYLPDVHVIHHINGRMAAGRDPLAKRAVKAVTPEKPRRWLRRNKKSVGVGAVSLVVLLAFGVATLTRIVRAEGRAQTERSKAERHRADAEELLEFMVGELHEKLRPVNQLGLLEKPGKRLLRDFEFQPMRLYSSIGERLLDDCG